MGFFSSLTGGSKVNVPATGYYALPSNVKAGLNYGLSFGRANVNDPSIYAPADLTDNQNQAISMAGKSLSPSDISSLVSTYQNPYDDSVINDINKQATGQYSTYKQALSDAGAFGSNRMNLGANDIDESRLNQINTFKQGQFTTSLQTGLQQRQQQLQNLLGTGAIQQDYNTQVKQAPIAAANYYTQAATGLAGQYANSTPATTVSSGGGLAGILSGIGGLSGLAKNAGAAYTAYNGASAGSGVAAALAAFSDRRLKEEIIFNGVENGHNTYEFSYTGKPERWIGVMADEVELTHPHAVIYESGYRKVNYDMIGVEFRRAN